MNKNALLIVILSLLLIFIFIIAATMHGPVREKLSKLPLFSGIIKKTEKFTRPYIDAAKDLGEEFKLGEKRKSPKGGPASTSGDKKVSPAGKAEGETVTLYFKDGTKLEGVLLRETENAYIVNWKGVEFDIDKNRIERLLRGAEALKIKTILTDREIIDAWPYTNDIVIRLTNKMVLDAEITGVDKDKVSLLYREEGGGRIEQDIDRSKIEYLIFKPIYNEKSREIENKLKTLFPKMTFYKYGGFTIVTDSYADWVSKYEKTLKEVYTEIYFNFFDILKNRRPTVNNFVVIFDDVFDYFEYALTDRVPGWAVLGYFLPTRNVLYLYNTLGDKYSAILFDAFVGETGEKIDDIVDKIGDQIDKRYHIFLDGQAMQIKNKFWQAYDYYKNIFREMTMGTLRHEFTHETFHNWGLQSIILSELKEDSKELVKKKKDMLQSKDPKEKARILRELVTWKSGPMEMKAANSWLAEGIATYCQTYPLGSINYEMLYFYQEMEREGDIYPIEALTYHKMGSFPGIAPKAMIYSYAESWAFVYFLMDRYPKQFLEYQEKMATAEAKEYEDIQWLLDSLGKSLQELREEFKKYMEQYEDVDDPLVASFVKIHSIFSSPY